MPSFTVKLFAVLRERLEVESITVECGAGDGPVTAGQIKARVRELHPALASVLAQCRVAVNRRFSAEADPVATGDEIALIPPIAGG